MDNGLRIPYHREPLDRWGDAGRPGERADGRARPSTKVGEGLKDLAKAEVLRGAKLSSEAPRMPLTRKTSREGAGARTANRHR